MKLPPDSLSRKIAIVAVVFGSLALIFTSIGIGTPNWYQGYTALTTTTVLTTTANFWYTCTYDNTGLFTGCTNRNTSLVNYPGSTSAGNYDYYQRTQNGGALCIVGILFLFFGTLVTLFMAFIYLRTWMHFLPPALLFLACLFMLAGLAEGSRVFTYTGYSANLYQTGHLLTIFTLLLSTFAAARINFSRGIETSKSSYVNYSNIH